jgi:hypothetical protein
MRLKIEAGPGEEARAEALAKAIHAAVHADEQPRPSPFPAIEESIRKAEPKVERIRRLMEERLVVAVTQALRG